MTSKPIRNKLFALGAVVLCLSCGGDPEPTPTNCLLTKWTSGSLVTEVEYNSSGLASKVTGSSTATGQKFVVEIEYGDGRILKINNGATSHDDFVYEGERLKEIRAMRKYGAQDFTLAFTLTFEYDGAEVVKAVFTGPGLPTYGKLYDRAVKSNGNANKIFTTSDGTSNGYGPERLKSEVTRFDDKRSTDATFPFTTTFVFGPNLMGFYISYKYFPNSNNPLQGKTYSSNGSASEYVTTLEYNEHDYPSKSTSGTFTADSEYNCAGS